MYLSKALKCGCLKPICGKQVGNLWGRLALTFGPGGESFNNLDQVSHHWINCIIRPGVFYKDTRNCQEKVKKISHLKPNQLAPSIYIMKKSINLLLFSRPMRDKTLVLGGKCFNIPHWSIREGWLRQIG